MFCGNRVFWVEEENMPARREEDIGATAKDVSVVGRVVILQKKMSVQETGLCRLGVWSGNVGWSAQGGTLEGVDAAEVRKKTGWKSLPETWLGD